MMKGPGDKYLKDKISRLRSQIFNTMTIRLWDINKANADCAVCKQVKATKLADLTRGARVEHDHVDPRDKLKNISEIVSNYGPEALFRELYRGKGCELLCVPCHKAKNEREMASKVSGNYDLLYGPRDEKEVEAKLDKFIQDIRAKAGIVDSRASSKNNSRNNSNNTTPNNSSNNNSNISTPNSRRSSRNRPKVDYNEEKAEKEEDEEYNPSEEEDQPKKKKRKLGGKY